MSGSARRNLRPLRDLARPCYCKKTRYDGHKITIKLTVPMFEKLVPSLRSQFPALRRRADGPAGEVVYFDGPAGTQVPQNVIDAMTGYLSRCNANHGGLFMTGRESD